MDTDRECPVRRRARSRGPISNRRASCFRTVVNLCKHGQFAVVDQATKLVGVWRSGVPEARSGMIRSAAAARHARTFASGPVVTAKMLWRSSAASDSFMSNSSFAAAGIGEAQVLRRPGAAHGYWESLKKKKPEPLVDVSRIRGRRVHGFVGETDREAKAVYLAHELRMFEIGSAEIGRPMRSPSGREADLERGMVFAGGPDEIAGRLLYLHKLLGHSRNPADGRRRHGASDVPHEHRASWQRGAGQDSERT